MTSATLPCNLIAAVPRRPAEKTIPLPPKLVGAAQRIVDLSSAIHANIEIRSFHAARSCLHGSDSDRTELHCPVTGSGQDGNCVLALSQGAMANQWKWPLLVAGNRRCVLNSARHDDLWLRIEHFIEGVFCGKSRASSVFDSRMKSMAGCV